MTLASPARSLSRGWREGADRCACPRRPGRLDKLLYVPLPPAAGRVAILKALTRRTPLAQDVDLAGIGSGPRTEGYSGADLAALVREAAVTSLKVLMVSLQEGCCGHLLSSCCVLLCSCVLAWDSRVTCRRLKCSFNLTNRAGQEVQPQPVELIVFCWLSRRR